MDFNDGEMPLTCVAFRLCHWCRGNGLSDLGSRGGDVFPMIIESHIDGYVFLIEYPPSFKRIVHTSCDLSTSFWGFADVHSVAPFPGVSRMRWRLLGGSLGLRFLGFFETCCGDNQRPNSTIPNRQESLRNVEHDPFLDYHWWLH